jgi:hypothetical protein
MNMASPSRNVRPIPPVPPMRRQPSLNGTNENRRYTYYGGQQMAPASADGNVARPGADIYSRGPPPLSAPNTNLNLQTHLGRNPQLTHGPFQGQSPHLPAYLQTSRVPHLNQELPRQDVRMLSRADNDMHLRDQARSYRNNQGPSTPTYRTFPPPDFVPAAPPGAHLTTLPSFEGLPSPTVSASSRWSNSSQQSAHEENIQAVG